MKQIILFYILLGWCVPAFCQSGKIKGTVLDAETKTPLELATVSVFQQDSTFVAYQLSDKHGKFTIEKLPLKKRLFVSVTYTGYTARYIPLHFDAPRTDTLTVLMEVSNKDTQAIIVTATVPIRMNGDTLEINPGAFKMREDAVVEELLNQVSGITIWSDGTITVNGRKVQNLLVDGKPFLGSSDSRIATQNLPKSAIEKIQLYQEYDRANIGREKQQTDSTLTMNIKLKENSKKGYFGKAGAGYGTDDRFESDLTFQVYDKKSSIGIGGGFNNINKIIGNLEEMFQNNTYRNSNPNLYYVGRFGVGGINKNHSIGGIYNHNFDESTNSRQNNRVAVNYNKSGTASYLTDLNLQNRTVIDNQQFIRTEGVQNNRQDGHNIGINYMKTNSYNDNFNVNGAANISNDAGTSSQFTEVLDSAGLRQSINSMLTTQKRRSDYESLNLGYSESDYENPLKGFLTHFNIGRSSSTSGRNAKSEFQSFTDPGQNTSYERYYSSNSHTFNAAGSIDYLGLKRLLFGRFNLYGINLSLTHRINYSRSSEDLEVSDYDTNAKKYVVNGDISNRNKRELFEYTPILMFSKSIFRYSDVFTRSVNFQIKFLNDHKKEKNESSFAKRNMVRSFSFFTYEGNLNYQYQKQRKYFWYSSVYYSQGYEYPSIDHLYAIVDDINAYDIRIGNPQLKNTKRHYIGANSNFNTQNSSSVYAINGNIGGGYTLLQDPVTDSVINDFSGKRISYFINADKSKSLNLNYNFNISRKFKKNSFQLMYSGQYRTGWNPNFIDGFNNISETINLSQQFTFQYSFATSVILTIGENIQHYKTKQTAAGLTSFKNSNKITKLGIVLNYPGGFSFSSTVDRVVSSNLDDAPILWNAFATYRFMKQQGELKFSAMDLLKQYQNITNSVDAYGTTTRITNGLQQYFLLTFYYYPRKFGRTESRKNTDEMY